MRRHARVLFAIAALASLFAFAGSASAAYVYKGPFSGSGTGDGQVITPGRAAVELSTGNLFVVDSGNGRVQVFKPSAAGTASYATQFGVGELATPWGIAIDEQGGETYVYVADAGNDRIVKYHSDGAPSPSFSLDATFASPSKGAGAGQVGDFHAALAVDPTSHDLLVADAANDLVERFDEDGGFVSSFDGSAGSGSPGAFSGPIDVAVNSGGDVYVIDATGDIANAEGTSKALRYSGAGEYKATLGPVGSHERPATVAIDRSDDSVVVSGDQDAVYEAGPPPFVPVLQLFDAADNPLPSPALDPGATYDTVSGLAVAASGTTDHLYVVLDRGSYFGTPYGAPQIQAFRQLNPAPPVIASHAVGPDRSEAYFGATINPWAQATTYRFEYGPTAAYGQSTAGKTIAAGEEGVEVSSLVTGLAPATTYHYRVVAENASGTVATSDATFTTRPRSSGGGCANEAIRIQQRATYLPDCRAYEMVTPKDKGGYDVAGATYNGLFTTQASGEGIFYTSLGVLPKITNGSALPNGYVASRGPAGWTSAGVTPPSNSTATVPGAGLGLTGRVMWLSDDFQQAVVSTNKPLVPAASTGIDNLFLQRNPGLDYRLLTGGGPGVPTNGRLIPEFHGATSDLRHVFFGSAHQYTPDAPSQADDRWMNLYDFHDGERTLLSVRPDDTPFSGPESEGMRVAPTAPSAVSGVFQHPISADGSVVFFGSPTAGLFVRIDGTETKQVPGATRVESFLAANSSGTAALVESGGISRFDVATGGSTLLTPSGTKFLAASEDLETFYFAAQMALEPGQDPLPPAPPESDAWAIYRWHEGEVEHLATLTGTLQQFSLIFGGNSVGSLDRGYEAGAPDGSAFAFAFAGKVEGQQAPNGREQLYVYDADGAGLRCASCRPGRPVSGEAQLWTDPGQNSSPYKSPPGQRRASFSPDGDRLFFETTTGLVSEDSNGTRDVYVYEGGQAKLLSSGWSRTVARVVGMSRTGDDVFIATQAALTGHDEDELADIYDVRVGGGYAEPSGGEAPACEGDACRGEPAPAPAVQAPASAAVAGRGNAPQRKPCARKRQVRKGASARCRKPRKSKSKRAKHRHASSKKHRAKQGGGERRRG